MKKNENTSMGEEAKLGLANEAIAGQFHCCGHYIRTQFSNFNLAQTEYKKELSRFPFMDMLVPTDMFTWLCNFANCYKRYRAKNYC